MKTIAAKTSQIYVAYMDVTVLKLRELSPILVGSEDTLFYLNMYCSASEFRHPSEVCHLP